MPFQITIRRADSGEFQTIEESDRFIESLYRPYYLNYSLNMLKRFRLKFWLRLLKRVGFQRIGWRIW